MRKLSCFAGAFAVVLSSAATDGTWSSASAGGDLMSTANWVDGVLPSGGVATINLSNQTGDTTFTGSGTISLTELYLSSAMSWSDNGNSVFNNVVFDFSSPAKITVDKASFTFNPNTLMNGDLLTVAGTGRLIFNSPQQLTGKIKLTDHGWLRAVTDTALGPTPSDLVSDAITLDEGMVQNGGNTVLAATRGITVTSRGGVFSAGYNYPNRLTVLGPVTGPGGIDIAYENSPVVLSNPANDWCGDTRVGTLQCNACAWSDAFGLILGADEVIPHGEGKGRLELAPYATCTNNYNAAPLDLNGHVETVNSVASTWRGAVNSSVTGGVLKTISDDDMDFRGSIGAGATFEKHGTGKLTFAAGTGVLKGEIDLQDGSLDFAASCANENGRITLHGGSMDIVPLRGFFFGTSSSTNIEPKLSQRHVYPYYGVDSTRFAAVSNMAVYRASWVLPEAGTYSFAKSYKGLAALKIDGETLISDSSTSALVVKKDVALAAGTHEIELRFARLSEWDVGTGTFKSGIVYDPQNGDFSTAEEIARACVFTDDAGPNLLASGATSVFKGVIDVQTNSTLTVAADAEPFVFAGRLVTDDETPSTLTIVMASGSPLVLGGETASTSAVLDAPIVCTTDLVVTNYVTLREALPENATVAPGATLTYDYAGALANDITLTDTDLRVTTAGLGDGTIVVPTGRRVIFSTQSEVDGEFVDDATQTRVYANNVILQGGTLEFDGAGTTTYNGSVSGYGKILRSGTGSVIFRNGSGLTDACTIELTGGAFRLSADGSIGGATVLLHEGRLANVAGENLAFSNPITANGGGFEVTGESDVMTVTSAIAYRNNVSKWGAGLLRLAGADANGSIGVHVRGGTLALAKAGAVGSVIGCEAGCTLRLEAEGAVPSSSGVNLDGGTFDLNGYDATLAWLNCRKAGTTIVNNGTADATVTVTANTCSYPFTGTLADGTGRLFFISTGAATWDFTAATIANSGMTATKGSLVFAGAETVTASLFCFAPSKSRPAASGAPNYGGTGLQISEFRLTCDGAAVAWPEGTTAWAKLPAMTSKESAASTIDGATSTKWYASSYSAPLIVTTSEPVTFDGYQFATANDAPGRDPVSWTFAIGTVSGGVTNWTTIDTKVDVSNDVPTARYAFIEPVSVRKTVRTAILPAAYPLTVTSPATAVFGWCGQTFNALAGTGAILATNGAILTIATGSTFTGSISSEETVHLAYDTATIPGLVAASADTTVVNDGVAGTLAFADGSTKQIGGAYADGTAVLGLDVSAATTLFLSDAGSTYTGTTQVGAGSSVRTGCGLYARYFRFTPLKGTGGQTKRNIQLSEIQLLVNGAYSPWPENTTATTQHDASSKNEGAAQLIDGSVDTKCYWGGDTAPVLITAPSAIYFEGYQWYTANDSMAVRNPVSWTFEYSMDGETWTLFDEQTDRETVSTIQTLAYVDDRASGDVAATDAFSDNSKLVLDAAAVASVSHVEETLGALEGAGTLQILSAGVARLNVTDASTFSGTVSGSGTLAKAGSGVQTLGGTVALAGTLVVEAGTLNLDGAVLDGVTNIVLKGGTLAGTATVAGDLTVTSEGGVYAASLAVSGSLAFVGQPTLGTGFAGKAVRGTAFTCGSVDAASQALFASALSVETLPRGWKLNVQVSSTKLAWSVTPGGTIFYFR